MRRTLESVPRLSGQVAPTIGSNCPDHGGTPMPIAPTIGAVRAKKGIALPRSRGTFLDLPCGIARLRDLVGSSATSKRKVSAKSELGNSPVDDKPRNEQANAKKAQVGNSPPDDEPDSTGANFARCAHQTARRTCWPGPAAAIVFRLNLQRLAESHGKPTEHET